MLDRTDQPPRPLAPDRGRVQALCAGRGRAHRDRGNRSRDAALGPGAAAAAMRIAHRVSEAAASTIAAPSPIKRGALSLEPFPHLRAARRPGRAGDRLRRLRRWSSDSSSEDPQKVIDNATLEGVEERQPRPLARVKSEGDEGRRPQRQPLRPVPERRQGKPAAARPDREGQRLGRTAKTIDFEGGLTLLSDRAFVDYEGNRVRSRPDHLRLRQVRLRTGPAAGRLRKQRRRRHRLPGSRDRARSRRLRRQPDQRRQRRRRRHRARPRSAATSTPPARSTRSSS